MDFMREDFQLKRHKEEGESQWKEWGEKEISNAT